MAGGLGKRLRPITDKTPKSLIPVAGKPVILYMMESLKKSSSDFILTVSYKYEKMIELFSGELSRDKNILFSVEKEPLGSAGGLKKVEKFVEDTFVVGNADTIFEQNIEDLVKFHKKKKNAITIGLSTVDDPSEYGVVKLISGNIVQFQEKPKKNPISRLANAGIYVMEPDVFDYVKSGKVSDIARDLIPSVQEAGKGIGGFNMKGTWIDIGRPKDLIRANVFMSKRVSTVEKGIRGKVYLGRNVRIGKNCKIEDAAIYDNVRLEDNVSISNSVVYDGTVVGENSQIKDSVLSFDSVLGEGVIISDSVIGGGILLRKGGKIEGTVVSLSEDGT